MSAPLIYIIAGEPSGDALGAGLMRALKAAKPGIRFAGLGGDAMQKEGLQSLFPMSELSLMGFLEVVPSIPRLLRRISEVVADIEAQQPAAIVTIDSPGFNFKLAKSLKASAKASAIPRVHYVAPSVWAYKPGRARKTAKLFDRLLTLLPFEPPYFEKEGLKTTFVGHPVLWQDWGGDSVAFRKRHNIPQDVPVVLLLPGSRVGEVKRHLPVFLESLHMLAGYVPVIISGSLVADAIREIAPPGMLVVNIAEKKDAFAAASFALSKSGTITLELAAAGVPMVVAHKVNPLSAWLVRRMIKIQHASLVNIAVNKEIVPEYLQERCTPQLLSQAVSALSTPDARSMQRKACSEALRLLRGDSHTMPDTLAAHSVLECIADNKQEAA